MSFLKTRCARRLVAAGLFAGSYLASLPARAEEDTNTFNSLLGFFGMQFDKDQDGIDYRARAPLVVPPKMDLPPPGSAEARRNPEWPNDPDAAERRRKAADSRQPAPQITPNTRAELSPQDMARQSSVYGKAAPPSQDAQSPSDCQPTAGTPICLYAPWDMLKHTFGWGDEKLQPGPAPARKYLTDPPSAYREPTNAVKYVQDKPKDTADPGDAAAYTRQSLQHKTSVDQ